MSSAQRRFSQIRPPSRGKVLDFDKDLLKTDPTLKLLTKEDLQNDEDYLILKGSYSGKIARFIGNNETIKLYGSFKSVRGDELRIRCDESGFACLPRISCWNMEPLNTHVKSYSRPPILLLQSLSICGQPPQNEVHIAIREGNELIAQCSYRNKVIPEALEISKLEETIIKLSSHYQAHKTLQNLNKSGFYVCYEDDGWLVKAGSFTRVRFMKRSHIIQITICRCGRDIVNAILDDYTLRSLLPVRMFGGFVGLKQEPKPGIIRRTSSVGSSADLGFDLNDLLNDFDKTSYYARIFNRMGSCAGNCLALDTPFLDVARSYLENGGISRNCIIPNIAKWRRMIKLTAGGDDPYCLMEDIRVLNGQWQDAINCLPNTHYKKYSFSVIYYDSDNNTKIDSPEVAHKILLPIRPKNDIAGVFEKKIIMNGGYLIIALSRRNVPDEKLFDLCENVEDFVFTISKKYDYISRRIATGCHQDIIYIDFQIFLRATLGKKKDMEIKRLMEQQKQLSQKTSRHYYNNNNNNNDDSDDSDDSIKNRDSDDIKEEDPDDTKFLFGNGQFSFE